MKPIVDRLSQEQIRSLVATPIPGMSDHDRDEMAIPSYLHRNPFARWLMWRRYDVVLDFAQLEPDQALLEFGCGLGLFLPTAAKRARKVYAIDLFPDYAKKLTRDTRSKVTFIGSVDELADDSLDVIVAADVMEHLESPREQAAIFSKLRHGGRLIISGPTENLIYKLGRVVAGFGDKGDYHHTNIGRLENDIVAAGFMKVTSKSLPFALLPTLFRVLSFAKLH